MKTLSKSHNFNINVINGKEKLEGYIVTYVINLIITRYSYIYHTLPFCCKLSTDPD